jgi:electron transfer flavoprotein beta subunit
MKVLHTAPFKIAVCLKEVLDARLPLKVEAKTGAIKQDAPDPIVTLNPADRSALEFAMQVREQSPGSRVEVFSVSDAAGQEALWYGLARGADYAERIENASLEKNATHTAALLATRFQNEKFDLICCGDETLDNSSALVGPLIAEILDLPQVTGVVRIVECSKSAITVERGLERGSRELVEMDLPGLITLKAESVPWRYVSYQKLEEAQLREIAVHPAASQATFQATSGALPKWPERSLPTTPRARVKKSFTPDSKMSPADRVRMIMAGGAAPQESKPKSSVIEGEPDYVSEQLYRFLKHHEFV